MADENDSTATKKVVLAMAMVAGRPGCKAPTGMTERGKKRRARPLHGLVGSLGAGETDQGEREADEVQGRPRGSGTSTGRQEQPWRL